MPGPDESVAGGDEASGGAMHVDEMQELAAELEEVRDRHLRLAAEFDNFRKRTIRERSLHAERAQAELVKELQGSWGWERRQRTMSHCWKECGWSSAS